MKVNGSRGSRRRNKHWIAEKAASVFACVALPKCKGSAIRRSVKAKHKTGASSVEYIGIRNECGRGVKANAIMLAGASTV